MESKSGCKVCVTGGAGYIGSALVHSLLQNGYTVHATLRNIGDESKVGLLKGFPYAKDRLKLFEADIYKPETFEEAIQGCVFVFHVATPFQHNTGSKYNDFVEATLDAMKKIADYCIHSGTVKRLIYTGSVVAASPLKDDGSGYKNIVDESCWTPLHLNVPYTNELLKNYTQAKTISEQEILKIGEEIENKLEVVTLACGLVGRGGATLTLAGSVEPGEILKIGASHLSTGSVLVFISQIINDPAFYQSLKYLEELVGKIPIVHIEDVCRAHIFCAEKPLVNGRFLCASSYVSSAEIAKHYQKTYPELKQEYLEPLGRDIKWGSRKLEDKGFAYKYDTNMILDECLECKKRSGLV